MTVNDYIQQKFQTFGIQLSEADLLDMRYLQTEKSQCNAIRCFRENRR